MSSRIPQSKIAFNPFLREAAQLRAERAEEIRKAVAEGHHDYARYLRRQWTEEHHWHRQNTAEAISQAKAKGDHDHAQYLQDLQDEEEHEQRKLLLTTMPSTPLTRPRRWIVPIPSLRHGREYTKRNLSSGEDSDAAR
jgi:hypothetical protein